MPVQEQFYAHQHDQARISAKGPGLSLSSSNQLAEDARDLRSESRLGNFGSLRNLENSFVHDALTGLFSSRYLEMCLEREFDRARLHHETLSLIALNVDYLGRFTDQCGTAARDILLQLIAHLLNSRIRACDIACRYRGGQYAVLMLGAPSGIARGRAELLRRKIASHRWCDNGQLRIPVTLSAGIASFPDHATSPSRLLEAADAALRRAMNGECNRVFVTTSRAA